jgi:DNA-directed RNA polymerase subunit alpha
MQQGGLFEMVRENDLSAPIEQLNLTVKPFNCLKRCGLITIGDILERDEEELLEVPGFGDWQYRELRDKLVSQGLLSG